MRSNCVIKRSVVIIGLLTMGLFGVKSNGIIQQQYQFSNINIDDGLSNGRVLTITQDQYGYVWLGTSKGINRFDGYVIKKYLQFQHNENFNTIPQVNELVLDKNNTLWAATSSGLLYFDFEDDIFKKYVDANVNTDMKALSVKTDDQNNLWVATTGSLIKIEIDSKESKEFILKDKEGNVLDNILECFVQRDGNVWIGFSSDGCGLFKTKVESFTHYPYNPSNPNSVGDKRVHCFYEYSSGEIWIGQNDNGISVFNPETESFTTYFPDSLNLTSGRIKGILKDPLGNLWVGTMAGLYLADTNDMSFFRYAYSDHIYSTLSHSSIQCIFVDAQSTLWLGTYSGGSNYTSLIRNGFFHYRHSIFPNKYFLNQKDIYCIAKSGDYLWLGTESGGLNRFDLTTGKYKYYKEDVNNPNALQSNNIKSIKVLPNNDLWVGTYNGGLSYFDSDKELFTTYTTESIDTTGLIVDRVYSTLVDDEGNLWLGTSKHLQKLNYGSSSFVTINEESTEYYGAKTMGYITNIKQDSRGWIWLMGHSGIYLYKPTERKFYDLTDRDEFEKDHYADIAEDKFGKIWFDAGFGKLSRFDPTEDTFIILGKENNIPQVQFSGMCIDDGNLWMTSQDGLFSINNIINSQDSITYEVFGKDDGLQSKFFYPGSIYKTETNDVYVGGINGFNSFNTEEVIQNPFSPHTILTNLKVNNKLVEVGEKVGRRTILKQSMLVTRKLLFNAQVKVFSVEFAAIHFVSPEQNKYKYMLEGYDEDWVYTTAEKREANYSNLPPGKYKFKVLTANSDNIWNETPVVVSIKVRPAFYKSKIFIICLILIIVIGTYMGVKFRENQMKADKEKLEASLAEGKSQLESQKEEIVKQKEEIRIKNEEENEIKWFNEGLAKFSDITSKNKDSYSVLCQSVITNLVAYVGAELGVIYLLNDNDTENLQLDLTASHGYFNENEEEKIVYPGEGYVGTSFLEKKTIELEDLSDGYLKIKSGLGEITPSFVVLVPMMFDEDVSGVIEIGSFKKIEKYKIELIERVAESTTSIITLLKSEQQAKEAVEYANQHAEEMKAADEELRQNLEELSAIEEELSRKQKELLHEQAMFEALMDFLEDRVTFKDPKSIYLRINKVKANALHLDYASDAIGKSDKDFFGKEHFEKAYKLEKEIFEKGEPVKNVEEQIWFDDGTVSWGSTSRIPFKTSEGVPAGTLIITRDITERKSLKSENDIYKELFLQVAKEYPVLYYSLDKSLKITQISGSAIHECGFDKKPVEGKLFKEVFGEAIKKAGEDITITTKLEVDDKTFSIHHKLVHNKVNDGYICCGLLSASEV